MSTQLLGVIGWSGSGKTTLLEYLITQLVAQGTSVNVIKHSHHDIVLEPPHKDSARLRMAGANEVLLASPYRVSLITELRQKPEPSLSDLLRRLAAADLTLVEGYKWEPIPKLEIHRPGLGKPDLYSSDLRVVAVAADTPAPADLSAGIVWLDLNQPEQILKWLQLALAEKLFSVSL
ncbi:molybdopterin-guanine dinucleotide biosynthesis protein B [Undibacterium sp. RTI2.1]|uniref:molybdopterin-guanine dinucleotide biosynthesis protein B n=1 Tax=unclassified Undibacterium TaxID=2630295 RepID=UPI002AB43A05|nr:MULTISPECIES: molybdopterin-guanine dinucleotide biosynthesis protein B [unclassified Undibacterium]MDY7536782.1 molybdopterin-guanine dinucleotide biosynthesis protein B [Undibacterium sp. 5I1]MEB0029552.1 molybdopterin-guanine dinucleotide biosynthesis protein B [Undibacterium sp. RTI2.1]MEB0115739.1 molybdopterin-guanine dinucleotide biosynthesis protein B [Undibacterium sp. RTI2.2]MEB0231570.1 molybdopterin-guanine dinucleotide biosynthesis protein B [Undibacterium sp. 10I3]MEB0256664.1